MLRVWDAFQCSAFLERCCGHAWEMGDAGAGGENSHIGSWQAVQCVEAETCVLYQNGASDLLHRGSVSDIEGDMGGQERKFWDGGMDGGRCG